MVLAARRERKRLLKNQFDPHLTGTRAGHCARLRPTATRARVPGVDMRARRGEIGTSHTTQKEANPANESRDARPKGEREGMSCAEVESAAAT